MDKIKKTINSILNMEEVDQEYLQTVPDLSSEQTVSLILSLFVDVYNTRMPFNRHLGINVKNLTMDEAVVEIHAREELYGNYMQKILHGGVIASVIDLAGGIVAQSSSLNKMTGLTIAQLILRFSKMSTINIKVDYLRPGAGDHFICRASLLKSGNKVASTRMDMYNPKDELIATGTGAYLIS